MDVSRERLAIVLVLPLCAFAVTARDACKQSVVDVPVTMESTQPVVMAKINGVDARFIADSGAWWSVISPAAQAQYKLRSEFFPGFLRMQGVGGSTGAGIARVDAFGLVGATFKNVQFIVAGGDVGAGAAGVLGQNVLRLLGNVEYDLAHGVLRLVRVVDCDHADLAYWVKAGDSYSQMEIESATGRDARTIGTAYVNGVRVRALFDTGASLSTLTLAAAKRAGVTPDSPGVVESTSIRGLGHHIERTWIAPVDSFKIGDETIQHTKLRIGDIGDDIEMLVGADFFLSHRVYVANNQKRLYSTYNGGPVFNLEGLPSAASSTGVEVSDEPGDAAGYSRRGMARAGRNDFDHALADLNRACELAPAEATYFYQRGQIRARHNEPKLALADIDQALKLKPDYVDALYMHAQFSFAGGDRDTARRDLDAADAHAPPEADLRIMMARAYERANWLDSAIAQYDAWINYHEADARWPQALAGRCWDRALVGQALSAALDDCNTALKNAQPGSEMSIVVLESRGLVRLRLGDFTKAAADYDAALKIKPRNAWALYGRGVVKLRLKQQPAGQTDIDASVALAPKIADDYKKFGIVP